MERWAYTHTTAIIPIMFWRGTCKWESPIQPGEAGPEFTTAWTVEGKTFGGHRYGKDQDILVSALKFYHAQAGFDGCTFIEGYQILSPDAAERFLQRGMFRKATVEDKQGDIVWAVRRTSGRLDYSNPDEGWEGYHSPTEDNPNMSLEEVIVLVEAERF
jgi:hypothetical protein